MRNTSTALLISHVRDSTPRWITSLEASRAAVCIEHAYTIRKSSEKLSQFTKRIKEVMLDDYEAVWFKT